MHLNHLGESALISLIEASGNPYLAEGFRKKGVKPLLGINSGNLGGVQSYLTHQRAHITVAAQDILRGIH